MVPVPLTGKHSVAGNGGAFPYGSATLSLRWANSLPANLSNHPFISVGGSCAVVTQMREAQRGFHLGLVLVKGFLFGGSCAADRGALRSMGLWSFWCRKEDSNLRPTHYECVALPTELFRHTLSLRGAHYSEFGGLVKCRLCLPTPVRPSSVHVFRSGRRARG